MNRLVVYGFSEQGIKLLFI